MTKTPHPSKVAISWAQVLTLLAGIGVVVATVLVAQSARATADRYRRAEILVLRVQSDVHTIAAIQWQGLAEHKSDKPFLAPGFAVYADLSAAVKRLRDLGLEGRDGPALNRVLNNTYLLGIKALVAYQADGIPEARRVVERQFAPQVVRLTTLIDTVREHEQAGAHASARKSDRALLLSLVFGVALLLALALRFERLRRRTIVAAEVRNAERLGEERLRNLVRHASDVICVVDAHSRIDWIADSVQRALGHVPAELVGSRFLDLVHSDDRGAGRRFIESAIERDGPAGTMGLRLRMADGSWRHIDVVIDNRLGDDSVHGLLLNLRDVSEQRVLQEQLRHQALHDGLSGLTNRASFEQRVATALAEANAGGGLTAVLFCDLDDFKTINDSLGHSVGDLVLREVAGRIHDCLEEYEQCVAARLGGDEFAVLCADVRDREQATALAERLRGALISPIVVGDRELRASGSIGIAFSDEATTVDELLRNADVAMYAAKENGKDTVRVFRPTMHRSALDRLELGAQLERAIGGDELELDFQPVVRIEDGTIVSCEALVRWGHPARGRLAPGSFIGLAETTGLIVPLGAWVLRNACRQLGAWHRSGHPALRMSVNVSIRQLADPQLPEVVGAALRDAGVPAAALTLELTESLLADDNDQVRSQLLALRRLGVGLAVDDFGTGYSALSYLRTFPIDVLKIDRSFVDGIDLDPSKARLVRGIVDLAASLDLQVTAEGIEREGEAQELRGMGAMLGQGFLFSRPIAPEQFTALLDGGADARSPLAIAA